MKPPPARKFGHPLFFCTFTESGRQVVLGGGGGASSTGVANRLLLVDVEKNPNIANGTGPHASRLSADPASECHTGDITVVKGAWVATKPYFMAVMSGGDGLAKYRLTGGAAKQGEGKEGEGKEGGQATKVGFEKVALGEDKTRSFKQAEIKVVASNSDGTRVAVGFATGKIVIYETGEMGEFLAFNPAKHYLVPDEGGVMNLCYSPCGKKLGVVKDDGFAFVWDTAASQAVAKSKKKKKGAQAPRVVVFETKGAGARGIYAYSQGDELKKKTEFVVGMNKGGTSFLRTFALGSDKLTSRRKVKAFDTRVSALAGLGSLVAVGSSEGDIAVFSLPNLSRVMMVRSAHMIFVTDLAFSNDGKQVVSVSADAGARITTVTKASKVMYILVSFILAFILLIMIIMNQKIIVTGSIP